MQNGWLSKFKKIAKIRPNLGQKYPFLGSKNQNLDSNYPNLGSNYPNLGSNYPKFCSNYPNLKKSQKCKIWKMCKKNAKFKNVQKKCKI